MPRQPFLLLTIVAISVMACAQSSTVPYSVKADRLGESLSEWTNNNALAERCDEAVAELPRQAEHSWSAYCLKRDSRHTDMFTYGTAQLLTERAWFHNDKLYRIELTFLNDNSLPDLMAGLKQKFGRPSLKQTNHLRNGFGSPFEEKRVTWNNKVSMLELVSSNMPGSGIRLTFTLEVPKNEAQSKRQQTVRACADM